MHPFIGGKINKPEQMEKKKEITMQKINKNGGGDSKWKQKKF
ncbi:MAG: hypothetical protein FMNOHCHN_03328 [Ignavibacteriaceae bacterium]|nr:hypothetical protein [Ignavibacteriaceae bacterium]